MSEKELEQVVEEEDQILDSTDPEETASSEEEVVEQEEATEEQEVVEDYSEDMIALFGEDLTEEIKEKAATIFEAAVQSRVDRAVTAETSRLEEEYAQKVETFTEETNARVDEYLDYVVQEWMEQNEVAIEEALTTELTTEFIEGLKNLFAEHYIDIPEDKLDVLGELTDKVEELEAKLNEQVDANIEMKKDLGKFAKTEIFVEMSEGLARTQVEKFAELAEGIDFSDEESYRRKLNLIRENYFAAKAKKSDIVEELAEEAEDIEQPVQQNYGEVGRYVQAISRTAKK
ncbi:MAG: hypothetical protein EBY41_00090 [Proteobacteria bacterium]|jgi:hypothetical protein|nr:hypothetical protein [Pseudomonadota bacterium]